MISFAQNAEDVVLWRLFKHRTTPGYFVDVGAAHPVADSVSKWFSLQGWRGVNIEPVERLFDQLVIDRPGEVNLQVACGAESGTARMVVSDETKWGQSSIDPKTASRLVDTGLAVQTIDVEVVTLSSVIDRHAPAGGVDFLKIDVEGAEDQVLAGADLARHQPRVLVIEAVEPDSLVPNHERWEGIVLDSGYTCVLFDGLSRFYCRNDDVEAVRTLGIPAYYGDNFITYREHVLRMALENLGGLLPSCAAEIAVALGRESSSGTNRP